MTEKSAQDPTRLFALFGKHLLGLLTRGVFQDHADAPPEVRDVIIPGTLLGIGDVQFFLTAGHQLKWLDHAILAQKFCPQECNLVDTFGDAAMSDRPVPFDLQEAPRHYIDDRATGLDFGLIFLSQYYTRLLERNGIVPVREPNWAMQHAVTFDFYFLIGFPLALNPGRPGRAGYAEVAPVLVPVHPLASPPQSLPDYRPNRFYGRLPENHELNLEGMSGGPIFGFRMVQQLRYWIVAIQSGWYRHEGIISGCTLPVIGELVSATIKQLANE